MDVIDRPEAIAARHVHLIAKAVMKMMGTCWRLDRWRIRLRGLEAVHIRHVHVQQDDGEFLVEEMAQSLAAGIGGHDPLAQIFQHHFQRKESFQACRPRLGWTHARLIQS